MVYQFRVYQTFQRDDLQIGMRMGKSKRQFLARPIQISKLEK